MKPVKRTHKIDNTDLIATATTEHSRKYIKTQSKQILGSFVGSLIGGCY